jgi:hypothetical protein
VTQTRIWPALMVLSAVAICGALLCDADSISHALQTAQGFSVQVVPRKPAKPASMAAPCRSPNCAT